MTAFFEFYSSAILPRDDGACLILSVYSNIFVLQKKMTYVLTFVASDEKKHPLDNNFLQFLEGEGIHTGAHKWLAKGKAIDIPIPAVFSLREMQELRDNLDFRKIDVFCQRESDRQKKLLLADMDSTIVVGETLDDLADFAGVKDQVAAITERAMNGEIAFDGALRERVALLTDLEESALKETAAEIQIMDGAKALVGGMKENGATCVLVTGGFTYFADEIGTKVGFDHVHGNQLMLEGGKLTGEVIAPILDKESKLAFLQQYIKELGLSPDETLAIGDGANDLPMLEAAGLGIGYHPKGLLKEKLLNIIEHGDLSAVLYAQGYHGFE